MKYSGGFRIPVRGGGGGGEGWRNKIRFSFGGDGGHMSNDFLSSPFLLPLYWEEKGGGRISPMSEYNADQCDKMISVIILQFHIKKSTFIIVLFHIHWFLCN